MKIRVSDIKDFIKNQEYIESDDLLSFIENKEKSLVENEKRIIVNLFYDTMPKNEQIVSLTDSNVLLELNQYWSEMVDVYYNILHGDNKTPIDDIRVEISKFAIQVSLQLNLDLFKVLFCGYAPCIEEYAANLELDDYLDEIIDDCKKRIDFDQYLINKERVEECIGSCLDMIIGRENVDFYHENYEKIISK